MMQTKKMTASMMMVALSVASMAAQGHVSVVSGPQTAGGYAQVDLSVPHGCDGLDTYQVEVRVPANFATPRAVLGSFDSASVEVDGGTGDYLVTFTRPDADVYESDVIAYELGFRTKLPESPFATVHLPTIQKCKSQDGAAMQQSEWVGRGGHDHHGGESAELPAPSLFLYPERHTGWNQYEVNEHVHDLTVFDDAEIVWQGTSAYSANPHTLEMIENDADATVLDAIHPGSTIWVKY